jgi:hypothetical protein
MFPCIAARLLVKVGCVRGKALGTEGGEVIGVGYLSKQQWEESEGVAGVGINFNI